ncbi:hypothetical protein UT300005_14490 [Clostridium sp. CTA-5]
MEIVDSYWNSEYSLYIIAKTLMFILPIISIVLIGIFIKINKISKK